MQLRAGLGKNLSDTFRLILTRKSLMHPEELLALIHHADQTAEAGIFGFEQGVEFAQRRAIGAGGNAMFEISGVCFAHELGDVSRAGGGNIYFPYIKRASSVNDQRTKN
jgi:hypothetical protein